MHLPTRQNRDKAYCYYISYNSSVCALISSYKRNKSQVKTQLYLIVLGKRFK